MTNLNRRTFLGTAATATMAFTIVPRHVLGGHGYVAPSDRLNIGYIGCGTQGIREMIPLLADPGVQIISVCDPNKFTQDYFDWSQNGIRNDIRKALEDPGWGEKLTGIPGGRDIGLELVNKYYARTREKGSYKACTAYADFRELLEKETGIDAIKIMTPDHLHATVAIASMKKGKHVVTHKPVANRIKEAKATIAMAQASGLSTHLLAYSRLPELDTIMGWIKGGFIGKLKEIHNWSNRPVWPQWQANPSEVMQVPKGMDWSLWLGPVPDRPYHLHYTHAVFRGWYDFGAGSIADMGHYSLFPLFLKMGIEKPAVSAEAYATTTCTFKGNVSTGVVNDVAFPLSCIVRFEMPPQAGFDAFDLVWYDGGMRPLVPDEVRKAGKSLKPEGMMFVGDKGKILADFRGENPVLLPESSMAYLKKEETDKSVYRGNDIWTDPFRNKAQTPGSFTLAGPVTETILLGAVALRARKKVEYESATMKITNDPDANKFLTREYRPGWEI
ncbi:MAG TPA: Gfo/Idh/MocA family oxidoreductase [Prolixibacteraceae bacterium]|nr:Gfo/Idh/MocA family oxidoreductase [Prolixibacteraceae bacterium]